MTKEITGKVIKVGKVKDYGSEANFGKDWIPNYKFFMEVESKEFGTVLTMVSCKAEQNHYGYKIKEDSDRQKPFIGDEVKFTTHRLRENGDKWASVTLKQSFEITKINKQARKDRDKWIAEQKKNREAEWQNKKDEQKQDLLESKLLLLGTLETEKYDERIPDGVRAEFTNTFNWDMVLALLRDTSWFIMPEGEGGKQCYHDPPCGCGYPGTGMRRPGGPLHGKPATVRASILNKAIKSVIITETDGGYKATKTGIEALKLIDTCKDCGKIRKPYNTTVHHSGAFYTNHYDGGIRYCCEHELNELKKTQTGCNIQTSFVPMTKKAKKEAN